MNLEAPRRARRHHTTAAFLGTAEFCDVALRHKVSGQYGEQGDSWVDDLKDLFQPQGFSDFSALRRGP